MRSLVRSALPTATVALGLTAAVAAGAALAKTGTSNVEFRAKGPVGMTIIGKTSDLAVVRQNVAQNAAARPTRDAGLAEPLTPVR